MYYGKEAWVRCKGCGRRIDAKGQNATPVLRGGETYLKLTCEWPDKPHTAWYSAIELCIRY